MVSEMASAAARFDATELLRGAGLRVTRPRIAVLEALHAAPHSRADTVAGTVRRQLGTVSTQAIYDVLAAGVQAGLVRSIEPAGSARVFELDGGDNHHHAVCRACGRILDVACAVGAAPCLTPSEPHDFVVDEAEVVFWGTCPACRAAS
jgi:Fur family ferric uptake transcriptional regulator